MRVRFWGTRGSIAKPGPGTVKYGGNTSCVEVVTAAGTLFVIDCGTGAHDLGHKLVEEARGPLRGHILISHTHWDHIQGIPFFQPLFMAGGRWDFYAPQGFGESLRETLAGQMEYTYFPVTPEAFEADVRYHNLGEGSFRIDDVTVRTRFLNHPALTLAYRIEADGAAMVYACDHEPHSRALALGQGPIGGQDQLHAQFLEGADLVIHDAQYSAAEYGAKAGWGHGTPDYAVRMCEAAGVRKLALTHHDPRRGDGEVDRLVAAVTAKRGRKAPEVFAAAEGMVLDLVGESRSARRPPRKAAPEPETRRETPLLLLATADMAVAKTIGRAIHGEEVDIATATSGEAAAAVYRQKRPALVIVDDDVPGGGVALSKAIRKRSGDAVPIMILGGGAAPDAVAGDAATDWLQEPFSREYARARIRTWLMRGEFRWQRPHAPANEAERLAALKRLGLLDTEPEERFDRFTRLAAALFDVPIALVTLIDAERQWFKSCVGFDGQETPREVSFCAHALHRRAAMVVPDALADERFADNPLVTGEPRMRFYAGVPLFVDGGLCMGTLCLIDLRPRAFPQEKVRLLTDLGGLVERELREARQAGGSLH